MKWTHDALQHDLAEHLRGTRDRIIWENMQLGPSGSPRPDVYSLQCSYARFVPLAYEIKISVSDFRRDITAGKWHSYLKFAAGILFAVPSGLISKDDVPPGCGLIVRGEGGWRTLKGPTLKHLDTLPHDVWMKLLIDGVDRAFSSQIKVRMADEWKLQKTIRDKHGALLADAMSDLLKAESKLRLRQSQIDNLSKELDDTRQRALETAREEAKQAKHYIDPARIELCKALDLKEDAPPWAIRNKCNEIVNRISEDAEINRLRRLLQSVKSACDDADKPLPFQERTT